MARLPDGDPAPADGALPAEALAGGRDAAVRRLRARAVLRDALRLLRLQHVRPGRARRRARARLRGRACSRSSASPRGCSATAPPAGGHRLLRRRHADAAGRRPSWRGSCDAIERPVRARPGRRGHHRGQPRVGRPGRAGGAARGGLHAALARDAERRAARAGDARPRALPRPRRGRGRARRAPPASSRSALDLIYGTPGETAEDWQRVARRRAGRRARPRRPRTR